MTAIDPASLANELVWLVLATAFMLPLVILPAVQRLRGKPVASPWLSAGAALGALLPTLLGSLLLLGWADKSPDELRLATTSFAALRLGAWLTSVPLVALATIVAAVFAFRDHEERSWPAVAAMLAACWLAPGVVVAGGAANDDLLFSGVRAAAYGALAVPVAIGCVSGRPTLTAGLFPLVIALGEASHRGMITLLIAMQAPSVEQALWPEAVGKYYAATTPTQLVGFGAVTAAVVVALVAAMGGITTGRERPVDAVGPLLGAAVALTITAFADLGPERMLALAALGIP